MTKIRMMSDLHLEFMRHKYLCDYRIPLTPQSKDEILVLAGDICNNLQLIKPYKDIGMTSKKAQRVLKKDVYEFYKRNENESFVSYYAKQFKALFYVPGNHDYYGYTIEGFTNKCSEAFDKIDNAYFLNNADNIVNIDGCAFIGGTLWTDLKNMDPLVLWKVKQVMYDYKAIRRELNGRYPKLVPHDTAMFNNITVDNIFRNVEIAKRSADNIVVVSHHAPSMKSNARRYSDLTHAYCNELDQRIIDAECIDLWIHGHTHDNVDYRIENTRVTCNCFGYYPIEIERDFNPYKVIEI